LGFGDPGPAAPAAGVGAPTEAIRGPSRLVRAGRTIPSG
jgi:hypothetical protein